MFRGVGAFETRAVSTDCQVFHQGSLAGLGEQRQLGEGSTLDTSSAHSMEFSFFLSLSLSEGLARAKMVDEAPVG